MSIEVLNWALSVRTGSPAAKSVLLILANRANHNGRCWPGIDGIAEQTELARRTVIAKIKQLEANGFFCVEHRGGTGDGRKSNVYVLHVGAKCSSCTLGLSATDDRQCATDDRQCAAPAPEPSINPKKNPKSIGARKRAPKDFEATAKLLEFGRKEGFTEAEVLREVEAFKDHEYQHTKKDWDATFRNWLRKSKQWKSERKPGKKLTYAAQLAEDMKASGWHEGENPAAFE